MTTTNGKSKIPVNLENYPHLKNMADADKKAFLGLLKSVFAMANDAVGAGHLDTAKKYFGLEFQDIVKQMVDGLFDYRGMMDFHTNDGKKEQLIEMYGHTLNPLHAAFTKEDLFDADGNEVTFVEKFGLTEDEFSVKNWMQSLMYWSYYGSLKDLAKYLSLGEFALVDDEKHENIQKLINLKPVLAYQKHMDIVPGKLIPGTGFFDCGKAVWEDQCNCCKMPAEQALIKVTDDLTVCIHCKAGYKDN